MFNHNKLRGRIREVLGTESEYSKVIGKSLTSTSKRLNGEIQFDAIDIKKSVEALNIKVDEISEYFFTLKV